ncbi:MAG: hypothetical protein M2R45_00437 [Verrucomicrobia subdivision 3 bacterium]|nr:hypothetical protein [Limisphaerales bacterium]MCS1413683.1 hypothetical protein [Limisphaerales bacterium]
MHSVDSLQCDRAFDGAEMLILSVTGNRERRLQCDRAFDGAEIGGPRTNRREQATFNVTARLMARKYSNLAAYVGGNDSFNVTARLMARK